MLYDSLTDLSSIAVKIKKKPKGFWSLVFLFMSIAFLFGISLFIYSTYFYFWSHKENIAQESSKAVSTIPSVLHFDVSAPVPTVLEQDLRTFDGFIYKESTEDEPQINGFWYYARLSTPYRADIGKLSSPQDYSELKLMLPAGYETWINEVMYNHVVITGFVSWGPGSDWMLFVKDIKRSTE